MKLFNTILFLFVTTSLAAQQESPQMYLMEGDINKNYAGSVKRIILEYTPPNDIVEIYQIGDATIQINSLFIDNILLDFSIAEAYSFTDETEIYSGNGPVKKILYLMCVSQEYGWILSIKPRGKRYDVRWYDIPSKTKELSIYYNILYPNGHISQEYHSIIVIM